ncbi:hypothetical protein T310_5150, partial [Rasamsonia emersonii CBS 393.64]
KNRYMTAGKMPLLCSLLIVPFCIPPLVFPVVCCIPSLYTFHGTFCGILYTISRSPHGILSFDSPNPCVMSQQEITLSNTAMQDETITPQGSNRANSRSRDKNEH